MEMPDVSVLDALVNRVFLIEDITLGNSEAIYMVRYRGRLRGDSELTYDQLADWLKPHHLIPLFRREADRHAILLVSAPPSPNPSNVWINLILALVTLISVLWTGANYELRGQFPADPIQAVLAVFIYGWPFGLSILAILGAHEFGHYLVGRHHGVQVSLPYFIPFPSLLGTLGAFISMKSLPKNRKSLLDIGVAGPFAGLVVAIPVLFIGLATSQLHPIQLNPGEVTSLEGNSILYLLAKWITFGQLLPAPLSYEGVAPVLYWLRYFFTSTPLPNGGLDVSINSVAWAGWAGLLVTAMNLIPAGQLDGGHAIYVLLGRERAQRLFPFVLGALLLLGVFWNGWWLWAGLILMVGRSYAEPLDEITPLDNRRKALAVLALIVFLLTFSPVPLTLMQIQAP